MAKKRCSPAQVLRRKIADVKKKVVKKVNPRDEVQLPLQVSKLKREVADLKGKNKTLTQTNATLNEEYDKVLKMHRERCEEVVLLKEERDSAIRQLAGTIKQNLEQAREVDPWSN